MLLNKSISLADIEAVDPNLFTSLHWMLENDITDIIDTTFSVEHDSFGAIKVHELKKNGRNVAVTEQNKKEYVKLYVNYRQVSQWGNRKYNYPLPQVHARY